MTKWVVGAHEDPAAALLRICIGQVQCAGNALGRGRLISDEQVHEARKAIKRARAVLRLLRDAMNPQSFRRLNRALRNAARPLTPLRDATMLPDTLSDLQRRYENSLAGTDLRWLQRALRQQRLQLRRQSATNPKRMDTSRALLKRATSILEATSLTPGWPCIDSALRVVFRNARRAHRVASCEASDDALHEWRKQVKHLWHALQVLRPLRPGALGELADQVHRMTDQLGDDHDLAVLRSTIEREIPPAEVLQSGDSLRVLLDDRRRELQDRAQTLAVHLDARKPRQFAADMRAYWHEFRAGDHAAAP